MAFLTVSVAGGSYDRTRALFDGRVQIEGCRIIPLPLSPEETFHRAVRFQEFDITELSLSSYLVATAREMSAYAAIPVFPSRSFRHSAIYVRADRGIGGPRDLKGRQVGVPEYQMTAAVWVRGMLEEDHGVKPSDIRWRTGGLHEAGRKEKIALDLPKDIERAPIGDGETLSGLLETGAIDALISPIPPASFGKSPNIVRLFPDYRAVEAEYFARTGIFPIMHVVGIRRSLLMDHPWLAVSAYKAYLRAKEICYRELESMGSLYNTAPWPVASLGDARALMGEDFWSYGATANAKVVDTASRYCHRQGLTPRQLSISEIFVPSTLDLARV
jgi:4,5-dihydroxyphthalate decarboxylase